MNIINSKVQDGEPENFDGDAGTVIVGATGPVHTGNGNIYSGGVVVVEGEGAVVVQGDNVGGVRKSFTSGKSGKKRKG